MPSKPAPTQVDLLALRSAPLTRLLEALDELAPHAAGERDGHAMAVVAELAIDESVRLIRRAPRVEIVDANAALARWCSGPRGQAVEAIDPGTHGVVAGLMFVLAAAAAPDGKGGDALVLRSWNGKARAAVELIAAAPHHSLPRAELRRRLGVSESYLSHLLADLQAASLVERIAIAGRRGIDVHLGGKGHELTRAVAAEQANAAAREDPAMPRQSAQTPGEDPAVPARWSQVAREDPARPRARRGVARPQAAGLRGRVERCRREGRALHAG